MPQFVLPRGDRKRALLLAVSVLENLDEDAAWRVTIEPAKATRTLSQNAYLFGVCYKMISEATGYELDEVHEYCLGQHFGWRIKRVPKKPSNPQGKESIPLRTTTTNEAGKRSMLNTRQFSDYVDDVQRFAAKTLSIVIPDPDPSLRKR